MKFTRDQIILTFIYLVGINIYYALWYLITEGQALTWGEKGLNFWTHGLASNCASLVNATILVSMINTLDKNGRRLNTPGVALLILSVSLFAFGILFSLMLAIQAFNYNVISILQFFNSKPFISILIYHFVVAGLMMLLHLTAIKNGGVISYFSQLFKGERYPQPVERGFAFIDLNGSTEIASELGHESYSKLIRKCFSLLDQVLESFPKYEIYQYVGDEAIITWEVNSDISHGALTIYRQFSLLIEQQRVWFQRQFGLTPKFKCAIHCGEVMESELGNKNPQTAFHGDVLNMASRILDLCHVYHTNLLVSQDYKRLISANKVSDMTSVQHKFVNGKTRTFTLYKPIDVEGNTFNSEKYNHAI